MQKYNLPAAAAFVLGHARSTGVPVLSPNLSQKIAAECSTDELEQIVAAGQAAGLKLYPFKSNTQILARIRRTLGFLHSVSFETMLDVGSGRGAFLLPFMYDFPWIQVTSVDLLEKRVAFLRELADGGFRQLRAVRADICTQPFPNDSFVVVTMLEVLEHIPSVQKAITSAVRMAKQYVVLTVPSKPDDNPEHIHLLTREKLTGLFFAAGCTRLHFDGVEGHLFLIAVTNHGKELDA